MTSKGYLCQCFFLPIPQQHNNADHFCLSDGESPEGERSHSGKKRRVEHPLYVSLSWAGEERGEGHPRRVLTPRPPLRYRAMRGRFATFLPGDSSLIDKHVQEDARPCRNNDIFCQNTHGQLIHPVHSFSHKRESHTQSLCQSHNNSSERSCVFPSFV